MLSKNGGSSSAVERQIVDLLVEGSIPFFHPTTSNGGKALLAQRIERRTSNPQVVGSSPTGRKNGPLAQLVEQQTLNLRVKGSIPLRLRNTARVVELVYTLVLGTSTSV